MTARPVAGRSSLPRLSCAVAALCAATPAGGDRSPRMRSLPQSGFGRSSKVDPRPRSIGVRSSPAAILAGSATALVSHRSATSPAYLGAGTRRCGRPSLTVRGHPPGATQRSWMRCASGPRRTARRRCRPSGIAAQTQASSANALAVGTPRSWLQGSSHVSFVDVIGQMRRSSPGFNVSPTILAGIPARQIAWAHGASTRRRRWPSSALDLGDGRCWPPALSQVTRPLPLTGESSTLCAGITASTAARQPRPAGRQRAGCRRRTRSSATAVHGEQRSSLPSYPCPSGRRAAPATME